MELIGILTTFTFLKENKFIPFILIPTDKCSLHRLIKKLFLMDHTEIITESHN